MRVYTLSRAQFCLRNGDWRTSLAHWMATFRAVIFSWMQHSCCWLAGKRRSSFDKWFKWPSFLFQRTSEPSVRHTLDCGHHFLVITTFQRHMKPWQPFFGSHSPAGLSLSRSVAPDQLPESADHIQDHFFVL